MKKCTSCLEFKLSNNDYYYNNKNYKDGLSYYCKVCEKIKNEKIRGGYSPEYFIWCGIKTRCYNDNDSSYKNYGARGIKVCDRWLNSYKNFIEDMGSRPTKLHSIDRIDNEGDYNADNCKWSTKVEQGINQRTRIDNNSGCKGVNWNESANSWTVRISMNKKRVYIGSFKNKNDAIEARKQAELKYWNK